MRIANKEIDFKRIIEAKFSIATKQQTVEPFKFNSVQDKFYTDITRRNLILKPRQKGISSILIALFTTACMLVENTWAVLISHESEATERLFSKAMFYINNLENKPLMSTERKGEIVFTETGSRFYVGTAGQKAFGRGDTINLLHISELPQWPNQEVLTGVMESVPENGYIFIESTANGMNEKFYNLCQAALKKDNDYKLHFFPWFYDSEYSMALNDFQRRGFELTPEEKQIRDDGERDFAIIVTNEHFNWRRWKIRTMDKPELFPQEYPANIQEAFLTTDRCYFDISQLKAFLSNCKPAIKQGNLKLIGTEIVLEPSIEGILKIWEMPVKGHNYLIGADSSGGKSGSDPATCVVFDRQTKNIVTHLRCRYAPDMFAKQCQMLGVMYNYALIIPEVNNHGLTTITELLNLNYLNIYKRRTLNKATNEETEEYGWETNRRTKPILIDCLAKYIRKGMIGIQSTDIILECMNFIKTIEGKLEAAGTGTDDLVISTALCPMIDEIIPNVSADDYDTAVQKYNSELRRIS